MCSKSIYGDTRRFAHGGLPPILNAAVPCVCFVGVVVVGVGFGVGV